MRGCPGAGKNGKTQCELHQEGLKGLAVTGVFLKLSKTGRQAQKKGH